MKKRILLLICSAAFTFAFAQQKAVTETGEEVILYDDGTWKYVNEEDSDGEEIPTNSTEFMKGKKATFLLKSTKVNLGFYLNAKEWAFEKAGDDEAVEYSLQLKGEDLYGMIITEKIEIPLETLKRVAFENGKSVSPDIQIVHQEYRVVNGIKVLLMQMDGTIEGVKFSYYGYYFSSEEGTVQYVTYTSQNLLDEYRATCEELLNGLVVIED